MTSQLQAIEIDGETVWVEVEAARAKIPPRAAKKSKTVNTSAGDGDVAHSAPLGAT